MTDRLVAPLVGTTADVTTRNPTSAQPTCRQERPVTSDRDVEDRLLMSGDGSEVREDDVHCWSCGDRFNGCPRCADEDGVK